MKKIMIAALGLSLLAGSTVMFAQDSTMTSTMKKKHKKSKKSTMTSTSSVAAK
ncbi:MAG: hypothetical protein WA324_28035 [Bryobacteraceae bacterium]